MIFVLYWQCDGTLTKIQEQVLISKDGNRNDSYRRLKKWIYFFPGLMAVSAVVPIGFIGWNVKNAIEDLWGRDYSKV
ncbi:hypothetical protein DdX_18540 [Ditylenchus destructor]|uniref:Uncharacterized protein n=1 Tax=Ditylenchus destructor TaxID=166010 RepID=A0AAD4MM36_9BILA|nr:hypothetical protein DdX_18540 [Ditylenchus destructor]